VYLVNSSGQRVPVEMCFYMLYKVNTTLIFLDMFLQILILIFQIKVYIKLIP